MGRVKTPSQVSRQSARPQSQANPRAASAAGRSMKTIHDPNEFWEKKMRESANFFKNTRV